MWVLWVGAAYIVLALTTTRLAVADDACREVARVLDSTVMEDLDPNHALVVAPYAGPGAVRTLLTRIGTDARTPAAAYDAFLAVGMTRQAEALRLLHEAPSSTEYSARVARALGLLALGDGTDTGTVARVLAEGPTEDRRRTARALSFMRQRRPQMMLWDALEDVDPEVRFFAAKVLVDAGAIRARRVLVDLLRGPDKALGLRAARVLAKTGHSFRPDELAQLPLAMRLDALAVDYARARRVSPAMLAALTRSTDEVTRAAAWGAYAGYGLEAATSPLKKLAVKPPEPMPVELVTALALAGEGPSTKKLESFDRSAATQAVRVMFTFASEAKNERSSEHGRRAEPPRAGSAEDAATHVEALAHVVEGWASRGIIDDATSALALRAIGRLDPAAGLRLARARIAGADGRALVTALRMVGRSGARGDSSALVAVARRLPGKARAEAWRAAARVCR